MELIIAYLMQLVIGSMLLAAGFVLYYTLKNNAEKTSTKTDDKMIKYIIGVPFVLLDWKMNWIISPIFWELPAHKHEVVTGRMKRYKAYTTEMLANGSRLTLWRFWFAIKLCAWLSKRDPGHCDD